MIERWVWFVIAIVAVEITMVTMLISPNFIKQQNAEERLKGESLFGRDVINRVALESLDIYQRFIVASGISDSIRKMTTQTEQERKKAGVMNKVSDPILPWAAQRGEAFLFAIYSSIYRVKMMFMVLPFLLPLAIPAVVDGFVSNRIRKETYQHSAATVYHGGKALIVSSLVIPLIIALSPLAINPMWWVIYMFLFPVLLWTVTRNVQHYF